jgi:DNA-binding beta-propeller fold protein YncE
MKNIATITLLAGRKRRLPLFACFLAVLYVSVFFIGSANAAGGWNWQFNLASSDKNTPFKMITSLYISAENERFYVVEAGGNSLHAYQFDGQYLNTFSPEGALQQPFDMARQGASGELWVIEKGRNSLTRIDLQAQKIVPEKLRYKGRLIYPERFMLIEDRIYVLDKLSGNIISYDHDLNAVKVYESPATGGGFSDFVAKDNAIWALDARMGRVHKFSLNAGSGREITLAGYDFSFPVALEVGPSGFIYILDKHQGSVAVFDGAGAFKYNFFKKGHDKNSLYLPEDIVFDPLGRLCVVDSGNGRVGIFSR